MRQLSKDLNFANKVNDMILNSNEMVKIKEKASWSDDKLEWKIPPFLFNNKDDTVAFPNINGKGKFKHFL
jgi:hypothetical protein